MIAGSDQLNTARIAAAAGSVYSPHRNVSQLRSRPGFSHQQFSINSYRIAQTGTKVNSAGDPLIRNPVLHHVKEQQHIHIGLYVSRNLEFLFQPIYNGNIVESADVGCG